MNVKSTGIITYSVIVLLEDRNDNLTPFVQAIYDCLAAKKEPFEIVIVARGTESFLMAELARSPQWLDRTRAVALHRKTSQTVCLHVGFQETSGEILIICGSFQQLAAEEISRLLDAVDERTDLVCPRRLRRQEPVVSRIQSSIFNTLVRKAFRADLHDIRCNVKVTRREVLEKTQLYGSMYTFLPIVGSMYGFRSKEVACAQYGASCRKEFNGLLQFTARIVDIFTLYFQARFSRKPLRFFGSVGAFFLLLGFLIAAVLSFQRIAFGLPLGDRPLFLVSILLMVLGVQAASVGLLGEIIAFTNGRSKSQYAIEKEI